jgi:hypothetical protein
MKEEQELFRQQVIDELNSKLNGEILLKPSISFERFLLCAVVWLVLMTAVYHAIKIDSSKIVTGELVLQGENNLIARFMVPVDVVSQIKVGDIISIQLLGVSEIQRLNASIKISHIDRTLSVLGASYLGDARVANLKVEATLMDSAVLVQNQSFSLSEGVAFSFGLNGQPQKLFPWLRQYLARGA